MHLLTFDDTDTQHTNCSVIGNTFTTTGCLHQHVSKALPVIIIAAHTSAWLTGGPVGIHCTKTKSMLCLDFQCFYDNM